MEICPWKNLIEVDAYLREHACGPGFDYVDVAEQLGLSAETGPIIFAYKSDFIGALNTLTSMEGKDLWLQPDPQYDDAGGRVYTGEWASGDAFQEAYAKAGCKNLLGVTYWADGVAMTSNQKMYPVVLQLLNHSAAVQKSAESMLRVGYIPVRRRPPGESKARFKEIRLLIEGHCHLILLKMIAAAGRVEHTFTRPSGRTFSAKVVLLNVPVDLPELHGLSGVMSGSTMYPDVSCFVPHQYLNNLHRSAIGTPWPLRVARDMAEVVRRSRRAGTAKAKVRTFSMSALLPPNIS
jgi:hypothetical protein